MSEEKFAVVGVLAVVVLSVFAVVLEDSLTGAYSSSYGYSNKVYGPGLKKMYSNPATVGKAYQDALFVQRVQNLMLSNGDKIVCGFDSSDGVYPCMFDAARNTWCCLQVDVNAAFAAERLGK